MTPAVADALTILARGVCISLVAAAVFISVALAYAFYEAMYEWETVSRHTRKAVRR